MSAENKKTTRRDLMRPVVILGLSFFAALFVFLIVLMTMRPSTPQGWNTAFIALGGTFIVCLVATSMILMAIKPDDFEEAQIRELDNEADQKSRKRH